MCKHVLLLQQEKERVETVCPLEKRKMIQRESPRKSCIVERRDVVSWTI